MLKRDGCSGEVVEAEGVRDKEELPAWRPEALVVREAFESIVRPETESDDAWSAVEEGGLLMGWEMLVERYMISFPWTTRLSLDFFRSKVSISTWGDDHRK